MHIFPLQVTTEKLMLHYIHTCSNLLYILVEDTTDNVFIYLFIYLFKVEEPW